MARDQLAEEVVLVVDLDRGEAAGWVARGMGSPEYTLVVAPTGDVADAAAAWLRDVIAERGPLSVDVSNADTCTVPALARAGIELERMHTDEGLRRSSPQPTVPVAEGYSVRHVTVDDFDARVEVHRAAWKPADLPWAPGQGPANVDPDATSSFDGDAYRSVRDTWLYDEQLDLVAVAPDGAFAGCCIGWYDPSTGVAELEPMGVAPAHRGLSLAGALCDELVRRVHDRGGREVFINTTIDPRYPARGRAYTKAGFEVWDRATVHRATLR